MTVPAHPTQAASSARIVTASTAGFTLMFAVWVMFAIIGLPMRKQFHLSDAQFTLLTALPVLTGSLLRLPGGMLADRFGGRRPFVLLTVLSALASLAVAYAPDFRTLLWLAPLVGLSGVSFAVGSAWIAQWVNGDRRGLALGTFGAGNAGASITKLAAPLLIAVVPLGAAGGLLPGGWRVVPLLFSVLLLASAALIWRSTPDDRARARAPRPLSAWLSPLCLPQVWRFGLYYVVFFGAYVALSLYLPKYYVDHYRVALPQAGLLTALFIFPASLLRPLGGYLSDRFGARGTTIAAFAVMLLALLPLALTAEFALLPFLMLTLLLGVGMGIGKASTYKLVSNHYPQEMGVVGGLVGLLGGLGGFFLPLMFSALKGQTGLIQAAPMVLLPLTALSAAVFLTGMLQVRRRETGTAVLPAASD
ncbi:MFS transporter [Deinococcus aquiradiocola]|uniref:Nitrate transporter n=1 Tax=Deinococcus aquiradiocola TaxID=393059 RepID=A0A917PH00_9DEIO|nr:MFS transporter [Deinococcus aquiradiocola]GGJ77368.1 nitrate transporter [Deinococcus aquiradiocola]